MVNNVEDISLWRTLVLAFQILGVVYSDMGTSPLYVFFDVFSKVPITLEVNVLYANVNLLPNSQQADEYISSFKFKLSTPELERALSIKDALEHKSSLKTLLLLLVLRGTSMIIGDGILTLTISVMFVVSGLQGRILGSGTDAIIIIPIVILVGLFSIHGFGTSKVGFTFALALALWFFSLEFIGIYNLFKPNVTVVMATNSVYFYLFFKKNSIKGWLALSGCVLCITEVMFADLGHLSVPSIQIAFTIVVFPCFLLANMRQAAYLTKYLDSTDKIFYNSVLVHLFWLVFVIATIATIIASLALIYALFSCVKQAMALGCFSRLKIVHTSRRRMSQIYITVINWFLMIMCIIVVAAFRSTTYIANVYD
ncbi:putative potassium transporter 12 [Olea europaea var. sylvestris]|uniref:putative potassium transporter 12 n=1 Tax=Olea europaea var. sylvestris TaxID=158386 RepID=UPI000C1CE85B|nr:putative potassium transporter 12 [Olea europaea var. sylvestris]